MKKLILALFALTIPLYNLHAMNNNDIPALQFTHTTVINPTGFTYPIPLFSDDIINLNNKNQADYIAQIQGAQDIIKQYQSLNNVYINMQSHKIQKQNELITQITAIYDKAQQQIFAIKSYDPLIQDQDILKYANLNQLISLQHLPIYNLILLSQEYIVSEYALSITHKQVLWNQINQLLQNQPLLWQELYQYNPQTIDDFSSMLPMIYNKIWNNYKFIITSRLLQALQTVQDQQKYLMIQLHDINQMKATLHKQATEYNNAFMVIHQSEHQVPSTEIEIHDESIQAESIKIDEPTTLTIKIEPIMQDMQIHLEVESAQDPVQKNAPKAPKISKKQYAAFLAAEKRAEQSKIDKERHRLALEEKKVAESKKLAPITMPIARTITKNSSKKNHPKKPAQITDEDFDAILNDAMTENNKIAKTDDALTSENLISSNIVSDTPADTIVSCQATHQSVDLIEYLNFLETRNIEFHRLEQEKEVQRKANLKKICSVKAIDRERVKYELQIALDKKFDPISQIEKDIINLLNEYAIVLSINNLQNISLEDFMLMKNKIVAAEEELQNHGLHIKWYLELYPHLYEKIKKAYLKYQHLTEPIINAQENFIKNQINSTLQLTEELKHQIKQDLHNQSPLHKQEIISRTLVELHKDNGILDISCLRYAIINNDELDKRGTLSPDILYEAENDIRFLYVLKTADLNYDLIKPIILNLLDKAHISPQKNLVDDIITMTASIICLDKPKNEMNQFLSEVSVIIFYNIQKDYELNTKTILTENQMADITKIHIAAIKALIDIIEV